MVPGSSKTTKPTVDGRNPAPVDGTVVYPIIYKVLYIPGGAGFLPSTVCPVVGKDGILKNPKNPPKDQPQILWSTGLPGFSTLPETNIAPTNGWLEYNSPVGEAYFQGLC